MKCSHTHQPENAIAAIIDAAEDIGDPLEGLVEKTSDRSRRALRVGGA